MDEITPDGRAEWIIPCEIHLLALNFWQRQHESVKLWQDRRPKWPARLFTGLLATFGQARGATTSIEIIPELRRRQRAAIHRQVPAQESKLFQLEPDERFSLVLLVGVGTNPRRPVQCEDALLHRKLGKSKRRLQQERIALAQQQKLMPQRVIPQGQLQNVHPRRFDGVGV